MAEKKTCKYCYTALNSEFATHCHGCGKCQNAILSIFNTLGWALPFSAIVTGCYVIYSLDIILETKNYAAIHELNIKSIVAVATAALSLFYAIRSAGQ